MKQQHVDRNVECRDVTPKARDVTPKAQPLKPRKKAQEAVLQYGGLLAPSTAVSRKVNYLVCGDLGNVNFRQSRFGNKTAKALKLKKEGSSDLWIVTESKFVESIMSE